MSYFISQTDLSLQTPCVLDGDEAKHLLLSRRINVGEQVEIQDPQRARYLCTVYKINKKTVELLPTAALTPPAEYKTKITLCQALVATQALDTIIQKATELGAHELVIFQAQHSPRSLERNKISRWERIALEAAKQSGRVIWPRIHIETLTDLLGQSIPTQSYVLDQSGTHSLLQQRSTLTNAATVQLYTGPEGGWAETEQQAFHAAGIPAFSLGRFTLRAETAAISALSQISLFVS